MASAFARNVRRLVVLLAVAASGAIPACSRRAAEGGRSQAASTGLERPGEKRLRNVRQLTFGGENAEAYFSFDGRRLIFQSRRDGRGCDQEYVMALDGSDVRRVSTGAGAVTCGYFFPDGKKLLYSSTHHVSPDCPPRPSMDHGYAWPLHDFDIYVANADGSDPAPLARSPAYDAEATISRDGWIVFTSARDGDLELYKMRLDGTQLTRLTNVQGYDGGAFFSADGRRIVYRASRPGSPAEVADYEALLAKRLVRPGKLEIWVMDADGANARQVTSLGAASFAPFFHPDGKRIIFSSNLADPRGRNFDLYLVNDDGTGLERVTTEESFDGFPMFSPDGKKLVFASNRNASQPGETNVFIADWVE
jgi:Tol biopolymer transport system component